MTERPKKPHKTEYFYHKISTLAYLLGAPNYWYEELDLPKFIIKIHDPLSLIVDIIVCLYLIAECGAFFTQKNLNEKQQSDLVMFCVGQTILYAYAPYLAFKKKQVKELSYNLAIKLKKRHNDTNVERQMLRKAKIFTFLFLGFASSALLTYGIDGLAQVLISHSNFVTVMTVWPDVHDTSKAAGVARVIFYFLWWLYLVRMASAFFVLIPLIVCLSHQYKNLQSYFCSLNDIFDMTISQIEKERRYEMAVLMGINLHSETLRCTREMQKFCNVVFGGQIIANVTVVCMLLSQMDAERTMSKTVAMVVTILCMLNSTGCLMWNAGDITVEASQLATAMFHSGWHHCRGEAAVRVRSLLVISMCQSQKPVELQCLGIMGLSYESFVKIARASYSMFSVLY